MEMERKGPEEAHERHEGEEEAGHEFASFIGGFADRSPPAPRRAARLCVAVAALVGLAGLVGVGLLVALGLLSAPSPAPRPPLFSASLRTSPLRLLPGVFSDHIQKVARPEGRIGLVGFRFSLLDARDGTTRMPLEEVYIHHAFLMRGGEMLATLGAEGTEAVVALPQPYCVLSSPGEDEWVLGAMLVNTWGLASTAPLEVILQCEVDYVQIEDEDDYWQGVTWHMLGKFGTGDDRAEFTVPGDGGPHSTFKHVDEFKWEFNEATIVWTIGHIHIGSYNVSLIDKDRDNKVIATSTAIYDANDFVVNLTTEQPLYVVQPNTSLALESIYDNSQTWIDVMSLMQVYCTCPPDIVPLSTEIEVD